MERRATTNRTKKGPGPGGGGSSSSSSPLVWIGLSLVAIVVVVVVVLLLLLLVVDAGQIRFGKTLCRSCVAPPEVSTRGAPAVVAAVAVAAAAANEGAERISSLLLPAGGTTAERTTEPDRGSSLSLSHSSPPLKIFVLVGQSNMQGHGYMDKRDGDGRFLNGTLEWMVETNPEAYGKLKANNSSNNHNDDDDGDNDASTSGSTGAGTTRASSWKARDDVWITYNRQQTGNVRPERNQCGRLVPGYGGDPGQEDHQMGPELGFGWTVGDALAADADTSTGGSGTNRARPRALLVKIAWGGKSLAVDFRPPSSGGTTGLYYESVLANVFEILGSLPEIVPGYHGGGDGGDAAAAAAATSRSSSTTTTNKNNDKGYEISGFAWHQGWNDGCNANMTEEYEYNLANLIRDVRTDLGVPDLPFVIGVSGMNGWQEPTAQRRQQQQQQQRQSHNTTTATTDSQQRQRLEYDPHRTKIIEAQFAVANVSLYPEFEGTVASAETRSFYRPPIPSSPGDQVYHWNNNCESYWLIGRAMGEAMAGVLRNKPHKAPALRLYDNTNDAAYGTTAGREDTAPRLRSANTLLRATTKQ